MYNKDNLIKELRTYVIEFSFKDKTTNRLTLRKDFLPQDLKENVIDQYHLDAPNMIATWNVLRNEWKFFNIEDVIYTQIIDGY